MFRRFIQQHEQQILKKLKKTEGGKKNQNKISVMKYSIKELTIFEPSL